MSGSGTRVWRTSKRVFELEDGPLLMAIVNVTPDSFSDGGRFSGIDEAVDFAAAAVGEGADILDIGGESTRPGAVSVSVEEEISRVVPVIEAVAARIEVAISVDTRKSEVAAAAIGAGAEIVNDVTGLRGDQKMAGLVASAGAGVVLMHSKGTLESFHSQEPAADMLLEVAEGLRASVETALGSGIGIECICVDPGLGFGKSYRQNLELIARTAELKSDLGGLPYLVGLSRKSFIGRATRREETSERLPGTLAANAVAVWNGADVLRVHDVAPHADLMRMIRALREAENEE